MKNLSKLKAMLASELESRAIYKDGFEALKEIELLSDYRDKIKKEIKSFERQKEVEINRVTKTKADTKKLEERYSQRAEELDNQLKDRVKAAEVEAERMIIDAKSEREKIMKKSQSLSVTVKKLEKAASEAEKRLSVAENELEKIRGQLKSI